jgi:DNA-binding NarL/FixJ family response regulator
MKRLLIVDNSLQLGHWLQIALAQVEPQVEAKALLSGEEALLEATRYPIDVLITDIRLTGMSGFDLIRKMRKQHPLLQVIVLTDLAQADIKKQLDEVGFDTFFNKPLKVSLLMDAVASLLKEGESPPPAPAQGPAPDVSQSMKTTVLHPLSAVALPPTTVLHPLTAPPVDTSPKKEMSEADQILVMLLSRLHKESGALAVLLLDENGQVIAQVGMFPDPNFLRNWVEPLGRAARAGKAVLELMEMPRGRNEMVFHGAMFDVVLSPIGNYPLVMALRKGYTAVRMAFVFEEIQAAHKELLGHLGGQSEPTTPPEGSSIDRHISQPAQAINPSPTPPDSTPLPHPSILNKKFTDEEKSSRNPPATPPDEKPPLAILDILLDLSGQINPGDADAFWDEISVEVRQMGNIPDTITFEEAQRMGLFHDTDKDKKK